MAGRYYLVLHPRIEFRQAEFPDLPHPLSNRMSWQISLPRQCQHTLA